MSLYVDVHQPNFFSGHAAPTQDWSQLQLALQNSPRIQTSNLQVILNEQGEYSGWPYTQIASFVQNGGIWIDWCGWPLALTDFSGFGDFPANFTNLAAALGSPMGYDQGQVSFSAIPSGWPYVRSLVVTGTPGGGFIANPNTQNITSGSKQVYSSFAIRSGKGAYIYAFGNNESYGASLFFAAGGVGHVPFAQYWPFIQQVIDDILGQGTVASAPPSYGAQYGTYVGQQSNGDYVYASTQNGVTRNTVIKAVPGGYEIAGTYYHGGTATQYAGSSVNPIGSSPGSSGSSTSTSTGTGNCSGYGTYIGNGASYDANPKYDVYAFFNPDGSYVYTVVDPSNCQKIAAYTHQAPITQTSGVSGKTATTGTPSTGAGSTSQPSVGTKAVVTGTTSVSGLLQNKTALTLGAVAAVGGLGYWYWRNRQGQ